MWIGEQLAEHWVAPYTGRWRVTVLVCCHHCSSESTVCPSIPAAFSLAGALWVTGPQAGLDQHLPPRAPRTQCQLRCREQGLGDAGAGGDPDEGPPLPLSISEGLPGV